MNVNLKNTINYDSVYEMLKEAHKPVVLIGDGIRQGVEIQLSKLSIKQIFQFCRVVVHRILEDCLIITMDI